MGFDEQLDNEPPWDDASALYHAGYFVDALRGLKRLVVATPQDVVARQALAQTALIYGDYLLAAKHYHPLATGRGAEDDHVGYLSALLLAGKRKQFDAAMPQNPRAWSRVIQTLSDLGQVAASSRLADEARIQWPEDMPLLIDSGVVTSAMGKGKDALQMFEEVLAVSPDEPAALYNAARTALSVGDQERAIGMALHLLSVDPRHVNAYRLLGSLRDAAVWSDTRVSELSRLSEDSQWDDALRAHLLYALGSAHDLRNDVVQAVDCYRDAGRYARRTVPYDVSTDIAELTRIAGTFGKPLYDSKRTSSSTEILLVVIGLPRSGTTLVEQILAAHSKVVMAGETGVLRDAILRACAGQFGPRTPLGVEFARGVLRPDIRTTRRFERDTRNAYGKLNVKAPFIVEKAPRNLHYAHAIAALDPNARIISIRRDPRDVCVSCMTMDFDGRYGFCDDLEDFVAFSDAANGHMDDLAAAFPERVLNLDYETLVEHPDAEISRLVEFTGLEMESACLRPDLSKTAVKTASAGQVRKPINNKAVGRWRRYEPVIGDYLARLSG